MVNGYEIYKVGYIYRSIGKKIREIKGKNIPKNNE